MKNKINLLIAFSATMLVVLCAMQYYLVQTAYNYKVEEFRTELKDKIATIANSQNSIDSAFFYKKDVLYKQVMADYVIGKKPQARLNDATFETEFKDALTRRLQQELKHELPNLKIDYAIVLNKMVVYNSAKVPDTLFAQKPQIGNSIVGSLTTLKEAFAVRNYAATTNATNNHNDIKLLTEDTLYIYVHNWKQVIYSRMRLIFIFSVFVILTLVALFVIAIRALIKQKKASDVKTDFINNITHELKTPLTTLAVSTKILQRKDTKDDAELHSTIVDTINRQNIRLQNLIDQVLVNSLGYEDIELNRQRVAMHEFLTCICNDFRLANPGISLITNFNDQETELVLDAFYLTTAITNVLQNAVKYGCRTITIKTNLHHNKFTLSIEDDGIGIAKDKQSLLFDKFYRVEQGNLHNSKGLGLGLYYTSQVIKAHKGTINVISQLGKGALFSINIPAV